MSKPESLTTELLDEWATDPTGPVALNLKQRLLSVDGEDGEDQVIYPPTYADIGYNIDTLSDGTKVALIDSVGSQANRLEPAFKSGSGHAVASFVPQIDIVLRTEGSGDTEWKEKRSLFDLAHRAADAVVQSSPTLLPTVQSAFAELRKTGNAMPLATVAPTSLVFGCWDSRGGSGEKRPRLVRSIIRAWDVDKLKSASQFNSIWKALSDEQKDELTKQAKAKKVKLSEKGFNDAPATDGLGGVVVRGAIERTVTINLVALRGLVGGNEEETAVLRKYLLALSLLTATTDIDMFLREGCNLRIADAADNWTIVPRRGDKVAVDLNSKAAQKTLLDYASSAYGPFDAAWNELELANEHDFDLKTAKALLSKRMKMAESNMAQSLLFSVRLHEGWYHGSDATPSPARLFQALVAGRGLSGPLDDSDVAALRFLEELPAPTVATPISKPGQSFVTYVPNNDLDSKKGDHRRIGEIRAQKRIAPTLFDPEVPFLFSWELPTDGNEAAVERLIDLANGIYQLGRTVDSAWGWAEVVSEDELYDRYRNYCGPVRRPGTGIGSVECPTPGSFDSLTRRYGDMALRFGLSEDRKGQTFRRRSKPKWQRVSYDTNTTILHFDLVDTATDRHFPWPQSRPIQLVEQIRDTAVAKLKKGLPGREADVEATLIGRRPDGSNDGPISSRVRIIPIPSIGFEHADRQIRRVVVEVPGSCVFQADDIAWAFSGATFSSGTSRLTLVRSSQNPQAKYYGIETSTASTWQSVAPIVLGGASRRRIEPDRSKRSPDDLKGATERTTELTVAQRELRQALRHAGIKAQCIRAVLQKEPFDAKGARVEEFAEGTRFNKHSLWHARIQFDGPVSGPLIVGDGRFLGLGVMNVAGTNSQERIFALSVTSGLEPNADPLLISSAARRALMARIRDCTGSAVLDPFFSGHNQDGTPVDSAKQPHLAIAYDPIGERILFLLPSQIDHTVTRERPGLTRLLEDSIRGFRTLRAGAAGRLSLVQADVEMARDPLYQVASTWKSLTAYVVNRHAKMQHARAAVVSDVLQECARRGIPRPNVKVVEHRSVKGLGLSASLELTFSRPVSGPLLIGKTRHKGGGLFVATDEPGH